MNSWCAIGDRDATTAPDIHLIADVDATAICEDCWADHEAEPEANATPPTPVHAVYLQAAADVRRQMHLIRTALRAHEDMAQAQGVHWGHVGDLTAMVQALKNVAC